MKSFFTEHWKYMAVFTACKLELFDFVDQGCNTLSALCKKMQMKADLLNPLLQSLVFQEFLSETENIFLLTKKGSQLTESHPQSYKYACMLWGDEHLSAWQKVEFSLKSGQPAFEELYGMPFFEYLKLKPAKLNIYHRAMAEYARDDYQNITQIIDFSKHKSLTDVGGSIGTLLKLLAEKYSQLQFRLAERPEVFNLIPDKQPFEKIHCDFFRQIPKGSDAIILSRILHDCPDTKAGQILNNGYKALPSGGTLYVIENFSDEIHDGAHLLTLNMRLMTGGFERSSRQYLELLKANRFKLQSITPLNELQNIIVCKK